MNKLIRNIASITTLTSALLASPVLRAEFEVSPNITVSSENKKAALADLPLNNQSKPVKRKKLDTASSRNGVKEFSVNKKQLFRCWQYGELIVAENGFTGPGAAGQALLSKGGQKMTGFDFGETFCLYMGS